MSQDFRVSPHALGQLAERSITLGDLERALLHPEQVITLSSDREVRQSRISIGGKRYLIRVIVQTGVSPPVVLTVYRTSKITKYWVT